GGMIAVSFIGSILVPAFFVCVNVMKEKTAAIDWKDVFGRRLVDFAKKVYGAVKKKLEDMKNG
nr:hypothetical protein [Cyanobacteria bacterium RUI128]